MRTLKFLNEAERHISAPQPRPSLIMIEGDVASEMWWDGVPGVFESVKVRVRDRAEYLDQWAEGAGNPPTVIVDDMSAWPDDEPQYTPEQDTPTESSTP